MAVLETSPAWAKYITLCALSEDGLEAVSESLQLSGLECRTVRVQPWRSLQAPRELQLDCSLLDAAGVGGGGGAGVSGWRSRVVVRAGAVDVEVMAPAAINAGASVKVAVAHTDCWQLTVTVGETGSGQGSSSKKADQGGSAAVQQAIGKALGGLVKAGEHTVQLPDGVFASGYKLKSSTRLSRALGLLCIAVTPGALRSLKALRDRQLDVKPAWRQGGSYGCYVTYINIANHSMEE